MDARSVKEVTKAPNNNLPAKVDMYQLGKYDSGDKRSSSACSTTKNQIFLQQ